MERQVLQRTGTSTVQDILPMEDARKGREHPQDHAQRVGGRFTRPVRTSCTGGVQSVQVKSDKVWGWGDRYESVFYDDGLLGGFWEVRSPRPSPS